MTETLTPHDAARAFTEARRYEGALAERTGGITWMVWGLAGPGIFLSYSLAHVAGLPDGPLWALLWVPWVLAGGIATAALWRSAALAAPALQEGSAGIWARWLVAVAVVVAAIFLAPDTMFNTPLVVIGLFWLAMGGLNLLHAPPRPRVVAAAAGIVALIAAAGFAAAGLSGLIHHVAAAGTSMVIPFAAGIYHMLQG